MCKPSMQCSLLNLQATAEFSDELAGQAAPPAPEAELPVGASFGLATCLVGCLQLHMLAAGAIKGMQVFAAVHCRPLLAAAACHRKRPLCFELQVAADTAMSASPASFKAEVAVSQPALPVPPEELKDNTTVCATRAGVTRSCTWGCHGCILHLLSSLRAAIRLCWSKHQVCGLWHASLQVPDMPVGAQPQLDAPLPVEPTVRRPPALLSVASLLPACCKPCASIHGVLLALTCGCSCWPGTQLLLRVAYCCNLAASRRRHR